MNTLGVASRLISALSSQGLHVKNSNISNTSYLRVCPYISGMCYFDPRYSISEKYHLYITDIH